MRLQTASFGLLTHRVPLVLTWLRRETATDRPATVAYAHLCTALSIPQDLHTPLLRLLVEEGYVTEEGGQVRPTAVEAERVSPAPRQPTRSPCSSASSASGGSGGTRPAPSRRCAM